MRITIKTRRDTASEWASVNPILSLGEMGIETDTRKIKFGDGTTPWNSLSYISAGTAGEVVAEDIDDRISELLVAGEGISLVYDDEANTLTISSSGGIGGISNIVEDTTPQLGGDLDINTNDIVGTGNIDIDGTASVNAVSLDILADPTITTGMIGWNTAEGSIDVGLEGTTKIHIGEHTLFRIRNNTSNTLYAGQAVYATGVHNNSLIEADLYVADGSVREIRFIGLILEDIAINQKGYAINFGHIADIDTRGNGTVNGASELYDASEPAWVSGDILYVHPTVPGKLTKVEPTHSIATAIVLYAHQNNGLIFVRPNSYGHLNDNHDVVLTDPIGTNQVLAYSGSSWINKTFDISLIQKGSIPFPFYSNTQMGYYYSWTVGSEAVINEGSNDINFRVEGNSEQNLLFVDAGSDKVGIAKNNPVYDLDVAGSGNFTDGVYVDGAPVVQSNVTGITGASSVNNIVAISQSDYDNLPSYDSNTIYIING